MLKAAYPFRINDQAFTSHREANVLEQALLERIHRPIGTLEMTSIGFVSPFGEDGGPLTLSVDGYVLIAIMIEEKRLPADAVRHEIEKKIREIEKTEARQVGKKEKKEIREAIEHALIPKLIPKRRRVFAYFSPLGRFVVEASSEKRAGDVAGLVRQALGSLPIVRWTVAPGAEVPLVSLMTGWLQGRALSPSLEIGDEAVLQGEEGEAARLSRHDLSSEEAKIHLEAGKSVTRLGLLHGGRLSFVLDQAGTLLKIRETDVMAEQIEQHAGEDEDFTARFTSEFVVKAREIDAVLDAIQYAAS